MKSVLVVSSPLKNATKASLSAFHSISFDVAYLCDTPKEKILKKDVTLDIAKLKEDYDLICPVGADALKHICGKTGIMKYQGFTIEDKIIPIIDPNLLVIKPQYEDDMRTAFAKIKMFVNSVDVPKIPKTYVYLDSEQSLDDIETFRKLLTKFAAAEVLVVDIETTSLSPLKGEVIGIAFSTQPHEGYFVAKNIINVFKTELQEIFNSVNCVFHNAKFDIRFLMKEFGFTFPKFDDTILLHYALKEDVGTHGLKDLALKYTDLGPYEDELNDFKKAYCKQHKIKLDQFIYGMLPRSILQIYACKDGDATSQLFRKLRPLVAKNEKLEHVYTNILKRATIALIKLENTGGPISLEVLDQVSKELRIDIEQALEEIEAHDAVLEFKRRNDVDFNPNSIYHLRAVFYDILGFTPIKMTDTGLYSTDIESMEAIDHELAKIILELRKSNKLLGTYLSNIDEGVDYDCRLRSSFNIIGTVAGRLSSSGVLNYQNLPRDKSTGIKRIFKAAEGYSIVQADLGTAEVYVAAVLSKDKFLQQAFIDKLDFHSYVAHQMFKLPCKVNEVKDLFKNERQWAKAITFGILFGAGPNKIAETANVTYEEAKDFIAKYFREASKLKTWIENNLAFINSQKFTYSLFGRKRRLPEVSSTNRGVASHAARSGLNFLIQSVASDITLLGLCDLMDWITENKLEDKIKVFATVHDSIVAEVHNDYIDMYSKKLTECLQTDRGAMIEGCPIKVDIEIGPSWGDLK